jgi:hypothetical protein
MAEVSISEAARLTGKSRNTLHRHIKSGKVSKREDKDGNPVIDTAELIRVYGKLKIDSDSVKQSQSDSMAQRDTPPVTDDTAMKIALLEQKINFLEKERDTERERREQAEAEKERWAKQAESTTRLLEAPKQPPAQQEKPGFWKRFLNS